MDTPGVETASQASEFYSETVHRVEMNNDKYLSSVRLEARLEMVETDCRPRKPIGFVMLGLCD